MLNLDSQYRVSPTKRVCPEKSDDEEMNAWKQHFGGIINSEPNSKIEQECKVFEEKLQFHSGKLKLPWWVVDVNVREVEREARRLKWKKSAGVDLVQAEHLKHGGRSFAIHKSVAFTAFLRHSFVPKQWLKSFIVPIIKDKKGDSSNMDNYRGIAISCITSKVLEDILIQKVGSCLRLDERQFGFKAIIVVVTARSCWKSLSNTTCTRETVNCLDAR